MTDHDDDQDYDEVTHAVLLLPGWRHPRTGKLHVRRDCRAVQFHAADMSPILVRLDDQEEVDRVISRGVPCSYCFPGS